MLEHFRERLKGSVIILGVGNTLRGDDAIGSLLASRLKDKVPYAVYDSGQSPENYLEKIVKASPNTVVIVDALDFGAKPGEFAIFETEAIKTNSLFFTHNAPILLFINYLKNRLRVNIIILAIQPKNIVLGEALSPELSRALVRLEGWFLASNSNLVN